LKKNISRDANDHATGRMWTSSTSARRSKLTLKVALGAEVAYAESEDAESVQLAEDILLEREQRRQRVQFGVQSLPMPLAGIRFCHPILLRWF